jgi:succinate dehydrogenase cytochrome b subunit
MASFGSTAWSSVGKKVITGITGLALFGFVIVHLIGNFTLFLGPGAFNGYAHFLESALHGWLIYAFEITMLLIFAFHIVSTFTVAWTDKRAARKVGYKYGKNAGGKSRKTFSSTTMIYTGLLLILFVIYHIKIFKLVDHELVGPNNVKNLYKVVVIAFQNPIFAVGTTALMILLGFHLRHGIWSAFQSIGWANDRYLPILTRIALVFSILLAIGFVALPIYLYFLGDPNAVAGPGGH